MTSQQYLQMRQRITDQYEADLAALERVHTLFYEEETASPAIPEPHKIVASKMARVAPGGAAPNGNGNGHHTGTTADRARQAVAKYQGQPFTANDLAVQLADLAPTRVSNLIQDMKKRGLVKVSQKGKGGVKAKYQATSALKKAI